MRGVFVVLLCFGVETGRDPNGASNVTAQDLSVLSSQVITRIEIESVPVVGYCSGSCKVRLFEVGVERDGAL